MTQNEAEEEIMHLIQIYDHQTQEIFQKSPFYKQKGLMFGKLRSMDFFEKAHTKDAQTTETTKHCLTQRKTETYVGVLLSLHLFTQLLDLNAELLSLQEAKQPCTLIT